MGELIEVYPKLIVFCPKEQRERDGNDCLCCGSFWGMENDGTRFMISCVQDDKHA